jgi:hypothetical protein
MPSAPTDFKEGVQQFTFGSAVWQEVERYDGCAAHKAICRAVQRVEAVDFGGRSRGGVASALLLLEVKDYRKTRMRSHNEIAKELAGKVIGTLTGIVAAARVNKQDFAWASAARFAGEPPKRLLVVLHVESPTWTSKVDAEAELAVLVRYLSVSWLGSMDASCRRAAKKPLYS